MRKLNELYPGYPEIEVKGIKINSKEVTKGDIFVGTHGVTADRHDFIEDAVSNGASAIIVEKDIITSVPTIKVENTNRELPLLASKFYNYPEKKLDIIGITGTNSKPIVIAATSKDIVKVDIGISPEPTLYCGLWKSAPVLPIPAP